MANSVPNINFLDRLVSEIWGGSQNKKWEVLISPDASSGKLLYRALVRVDAYKCAKFQVPSSISYGDMEGVPE